MKLCKIEKEYCYYKLIISIMNLPNPSIKT